MMVKSCQRTKNHGFWTRQRKSSSPGLQFTYSANENTWEKKGEIEVNKIGSDNEEVVLVKRIRQLKKVVVGEGVKPSMRV